MSQFIVYPAQTLTIDELRALMVKHYSNQRNEDKYGIMYAIGHIDFHNGYKWEGSKRAEYLSEFVRLMQDDAKVLRLHSFTTFSNITIL